MPGGRRVLLNRKLGNRGKAADTAVLDELTYLLKSGSDRIGALDFQHSPTIYEPRDPARATLEELMDAARRVDEGLPLSVELDQALNYGTSIGGARPKALIADGDKKHIAKFSASRDIYPVVKWEFLAMTLAARVGLDVAPVQLVSTAGSDALLIDRFDRVSRAGAFERCAMVSALTLLGLDESLARYASYADLAEIIRHRFARSRATLREFYGRLCFNILVGNTDDHARNHAAFWDGQRLELTPAYDICPQARTGGEASQAMLIAGEERLSRLSLCLDAAETFLLGEEEAIALIENQITTMGKAWPELAATSRLTEAERDLIWGRQLLNPFAFEGLEGPRRRLAEIAEEVREGGRQVAA